MQAELMYRKPTTIMTRETSSGHQNPHHVNRSSRDSRETIHSGHFMVSDFEAEAQDDEDELAVPVPEEEAARLAIIAPVGFSLERFVTNPSTEKSAQQLSIETSLNKLFQCMSLAYRQKLTSPKWNRFKGIRLRWKDKIRLNNVIWRCWHMQFILKQSTLVCQFASPLDVDTHNKPEAVVLEGKYWKRKLAAVTAEYKKWRMFYRNKILGWTNKDGTDMMESMDMLDWDGVTCSSIGFGGSMANLHGNSIMQGPDSMMVDEDYMELMTDTLFSTISSNQPIYFPDPREIARGASLADFIQPSLGPLQPNLDDFMDTLEPLQEFLNSKLPPVPEEEDLFRSSGINNNYSDLDLMTPITQVNQQINESSTTNDPQQNSIQRQGASIDMQNLHYTAKIYTQPETSAGLYRNNTNITDNYSTVHQSYENPAIRDKITRSGRSTTRSNRVIQQSHQHTSFNQSPQHQILPYQLQQQQQSQSTRRQQTTYNTLDLQAIQMNSNTNQVAMGTLTNVINTNSISGIEDHHLASQSNFSQPNSSQDTQQQTIRSLPTTVNPQVSDPFKLLQSQQNYKLPTNSSQTFNVQQYKFKSNNLKNTSTQPVAVAVPSSSPTQSHILLQCKSTSGLDLTAPSTHSTKLLPRPTNATNVEKEDIFAVPKYQMKARSRSRSSSALSAPRIHPPPLVSAVSDPTLNLNNNVLLAHLLTSSTSSLYTVTSGSEKVMNTATNQTSGMKNILPMLPPNSIGQVNKPQHHMTTPMNVQTLHNTTTVQTQAQHHQDKNGQQVMLNATSQNHQQGQQCNSPNSPKDMTSNAHSPQAALNISPLHSPLNIGSPLSPSRIFIKGEPERGQYKEQRRVGHIHAEQKRRYNIKNGFDTLHNLIPQLSQNPNTKLSKAAMLQKGADYIRQLRMERNQLKEEMDSLRHQIECLNTSISNCQSMLPATGAPVSRHRTNKMKEMFDDYVRKRTRENWKFWIFSILLEPLMISFNTSVSTASIEDLCRSTILWVEQHCSLVDLRPAVLNSLRHLCTATEILSDPGRLPEEALAAVNNTDNEKSM